MHKKLKALIEQRIALVSELEKLAAAIETKNAEGKTEYRAFTEEEQRAYDEKATEVDKLTATISALREERNADMGAPADNDGVLPDSDDEERAFNDYLKSSAFHETRADNFTVGENGAVIPANIANKIVTEIEEISPVFQRATKYYGGGSLSIPYYDENDKAITTAYAEEFAELTSSSGKFGSITLKGYLAGTLSLISRSLMNNSKFNLLSFLIGRMSVSNALFIEHEIFNGTPDKITGLSAAKNVVTAAAAKAVTVDELIDVQESVPDVYQRDAIWVMSRNTRKAIRKLRDGDGNLLLNRDATAKWGYTLFGKDVYISSEVKDMDTGNRAIYYGDFSGLAIKMTETPSVEVLREQYSTQHAIGINSWMELDAKIENEQKIAVLQMA